jgi:hypothetical protein
MRKYREPLLVNGCLAMLLGVLWVNMHVHEGLGSVVLVMLGLWTLPLANFVLFLQLLLAQRLRQDQRPLRLVYGLLTVACFAVAWLRWSS